jgi:hypothetical protein
MSSPNINSPTAAVLEVRILEDCLSEILNVIEATYKRLDAFEEHPSHGVRRPLTIHTADGNVYELRKTAGHEEVTL